MFITRVIKATNHRLRTRVLAAADNAFETLREGWDWVCTEKIDKMTGADELIATHQQTAREAQAALVEAEDTIIEQKRIIQSQAEIIVSLKSTVKFQNLRYNKQIRIDRLVARAYPQAAPGRKGELTSTHLN